MDNEKEITHIDLFSGIGGFTLAAEWAGFKTVVFCEKEKFCQKVLKKHWPQIPIIPEIRDFDGTKYRGATILSGGFPCQPFSVAGQRRGKEDNRYLWPEMLRVIDEAKPHWILAENVPGIFRMALDTVLADLEGQGYTTGTFIIPACGLNAPHRRNRVWIVANSRCEYGEGTENKGKLKRSILKKENASLPERSIKNDGLGNVSNASSNRYQRRREEARGAKRESEQGGMRESERTNSHAQNTIGTGTRNQGGKIGDQNRQISQDRREGIQQKDGTISTGGFISTDKYAPDSDSRRTRRHESEGVKERSITCSSDEQVDRHSNNHNVQRGRKQSNCKDSLGLYNRKNSAWEKDWYEIATRFCRVDDGVSDRIHRLKALGNAIVPQVAFEIMKNIAWIEKQNKLK